MIKDLKVTVQYAGRLAISHAEEVKLLEESKIQIIGFFETFGKVPEKGTCFSSEDFDEYFVDTINYDFIGKEILFWVEIGNNLTTEKYKYNVWYDED